MKSFIFYNVNRPLFNASLLCIFFFTLTLSRIPYFSPIKN